MPTQPTYLRIVSHLQQRMQSGELPVGAKVPSTRQIMTDFKVAMATATKALTTLRQTGWVRAIPGVGTVVAQRTAPAREASDPVDLRRIVQVAIGIADREGMREVSMRRIATELGVSTMALYRYVPGKEELSLAMLDTVYAEEPPPATGGMWRTTLEEGARMQWRMYHRHPWAAQAMSFTRPTLAPHGMVHTEALMRAVDGRGLSTVEMLSVALSITGFVRGLAANIEMEKVAQQDTGIDHTQWMQSQQSNFESVMQQQGMTMLIRLSQVDDTEMSLDTFFEFGLQCLLDGIDARLRGAAHDVRGPA